MANVPLTYWIDVAGQSIRVREAKGQEGISRPFYFEIRFAEEEGVSLDPEALLRSKATLRLVRKGDVRRIDGIITKATVGVSKNRAPEVFLVLEPTLVLAKYRQDIRVFRKKTAPEIIVAVLSALGIKTELRLTESYERREYCVQMRETDFDFAARLMEDEGIHYFLLEGDVMVLGDKASAYEEGGPLLPFRGGQGLDQNDDAIVALGARSAMGPTKMTLRDWNPEHPSLDMEVVAKTPCPGGPEYYDYPGEYPEPSAGQRKVGLRAEAVAVAHAAIEGKSLSALLFPGGIFNLEDAPSPYADGGYVVISTTHDFQRDGDGFTLGFEMLRESVVYRPLVATHIPVLLNPHTGFVTGASGDDIHTDEVGRVKVHFQWDRLQPYDDDCSDWVPILQDNTGHSVAISRVGWEVLVHFLEGDPDRPVVLGRVYNPEDDFPQRLPEMKTRSALKSMTSPREPYGSEEITGTNEIQFEDLVGEQRIFIHAEKDQNVVVANNKTEIVTNNETRVIKRDEKISIGANQALKVGGDFLPTIQGNQTWAVGGERTVTIKGADAGAIQGDRQISIGGMHVRLIAKDDRTLVEQSLTETIGAVAVEVSKKNNLVAADLASSLLVGGAIIEIAKEGKMESASKGRFETVGGLVYENAGHIIATRVDKLRKTSVGGSMMASSVKEMAVTGLEKLSTLSATALFGAEAKLTLKVGNSEISFKEGVISLSASDNITIDTSSDNLLGSGKSSQI